MITVNQLTFHYSPARPLFKQFDMQVGEGELFGLVGPNGAGKSTLIGLICGLYTPLGGTIEINGMRMEQQRHEVLQNLALVPQDYAFYPRLSAMENLEFFASLYPATGPRRAAIERAIELSGIADFAYRPAHTYSGGMKRRLNLAIGLLNRPQLLILDEPTVGIDPQSRHFILQAIRDINEQGTTIVYTSHYMEEVEQLCERVLIMDHGRELISGRLQDILGRPAQLRLHLASIPDEAQQVLAMLGNRFQLEQQGHQLRGELASLTQLDALLCELKQQHLEVEYMEYGKQSLEALFFELTDTRLREH